MATIATREQLLDAAQDLARRRGYNAFSFKDLESLVGIRTASIHYHFPTKADLGAALMRRYRITMLDALAELRQTQPDARKRLWELVEFLRKSSKKGTQMCLCGMLGVEFSTLPSPVQKEVRQTFDAVESWIAELLEEGRKAKSLAVDRDSRKQARALFSALQGALLSACAFEDEERFTSAAQFYIRCLEA